MGPDILGTSSHLHSSEDNYASSKSPSQVRSPTRARKAKDDSRETALRLYSTYQEDIEHFVDYLEKRPTLDKNNNNKIRCIVLPHLCTMRDYFDKMNNLDRSPVDLQALKNLILWLHHFQKQINEHKDIEASLKEELSTVRAAVKTAANSMCVRAMLPSICSPRPLKIAPLPLPTSDVILNSCSDNRQNNRYGWQYES